MKTKYLFAIYFILIFQNINTIKAQVLADISIENMNIVGTDLYFDIYTTRTGSNNVCLGGSDFIIGFNSIYFTNPTITKVANPSPPFGLQNGFCTFVSATNNTQGEILTTVLQKDYYDATSATIINNSDGTFLAVNLNSPNFSDQTTFDANVALIDNSPSTHRLGRFKLSGISNTNGTANFQWRTAIPNNTILFSFATTDPWLLSPITINPINPSDIPLPVELQSFEATIDGNNIVLKWVTATELNNYGFDIEREIIENNGENSNWEELGFVEGHGNSNSLNSYSFTDHSIIKSGRYNYRLKQINTDGSYEYSDAISVEVNTPIEYSLEQNYPNPFNPSTKINFSIPEEGFVKLSIFTILGEKIETLIQEFKESGSYTVNFNASQLNSGVYIYKLEVNEFVKINKMILLK